LPEFELFGFYLVGESRTDIVILGILSLTMTVLGRLLLLMVINFCII